MNNQNEPTEQSRLYLERRAVFQSDLEDVHKNGSQEMTIRRCVSAEEATTGVARQDTVGTMQVADALADQELLQNVRKTYGRGIYLFKLWKEDLTLHSDHEFFLTSENEATEEECCKLVDPRDAQVDEYGVLMGKCLNVVSELMDEVYICPEPGPLRSELQTQLGIVLFNRSTRVMPAQDNIYRLALEYVGLLMKEKEADMKRSEEFKPVGPLVTYPGSGFISGVVCEHPGLKMIYRHWKPGEEDVISKSESILAGNIFEAMAIEEADLGGFFEGDAIRCPHCSALLSLEKVKSGEIWDELAAASAKKASEASMRADAVRKLHEEDKKRGKKEPGES